MKDVNDIYETERIDRHNHTNSYVNTDNFLNALTFIISFDPYNKAYTSNRHYAGEETDSYKV